MTRHPGGRRRYDSTNRRYSVSSDEQEEVEASTASLDPNAANPEGAARGPSKSPLVRAKALATKLRDSIITTSSAQPETVWTARNNYAWDTQLLYKRKVTNLYVTATSLRSYVELNYSGFRKILKKYVFLFSCLGHCSGSRESAICPGAYSKI